jgi:hypothetical protein
VENFGVARGPLVSPPEAVYLELAATPAQLPANEDPKSVASHAAPAICSKARRPDAAAAAVVARPLAILLLLSRP